MCFGTLVIPDLHQEYLRHLEPLCFVQAVLQVLLLELLQVAVLVLTVVQLPDFHLRDFLVKHLDFPVPLLGECLDFPGFVSVTAPNFLYQGLLRQDFLYLVFLVVCQELLVRPVAQVLQFESPLRFLVFFQGYILVLCLSPHFQM